jgi:hypothetical protein
VSNALLMFHQHSMTGLDSIVARSRTSFRREVTRADGMPVRATLRPLSHPLAGGIATDRRPELHRSDHAVEVIARRTPWIMRAIARLAPATERR